MIGINTIQLGDTANHKKHTLAKFGTAENFYNEITATMKDMGVTLAYAGDYLSLLSVENGLPVIISIDIMDAYMIKLGRGKINQSEYPHNNTLNVFDPDFIKSANVNVEAKIKTNGYADMKNVFGYITDNELPSGSDILDRYLIVDTSEPTNAFSYAVAWTWLARRMDTPAPTLVDFVNSPDHEKMNQEFLSFLYSRYYDTARKAIEAVDQNHMYLGSRVNDTCITDEGYLRAAGHYVDIVTINLYGGLNPSAETLNNFYRYSGKPFIVTEFYAKAMDSIDANGFMLANSVGAGILVKTQQDRADYYEHYMLSLLESKACLGGIWYCFRDNDQSLYRKAGTSNTMIMLHVELGEMSTANSFMDETGKILTAKEVGGNYYEIYRGDGFGSNQNVNKGIYNNDYTSTVAVYSYDKDGKLLSSSSYAVEKPESETPAAGTVLKALKSDATYTIGKAMNDDGSYTETVLTVFEGKYLAFGTAIHNISSHVMGIIDYFDAE